MIRNQSGSPGSALAGGQLVHGAHELGHDAGIPGETGVEGGLHLVEGVEHAVAVEVTGSSAAA